MNYFPFYLALLSGITLSAQQYLPVQTCVSVPSDSVSLLSQNKVASCVQKQYHSVTGAYLNTVTKQYNEKGCLTLLLLTGAPNGAGGNTEGQVYEYDANGIVTGHRRFRYRKDSTEQVYHRETFRTDAQKRYTEAHFDYSNGHASGDFTVVAEDFLYTYDGSPYGFVVKHIKRSAKDTLNVNTWYFANTTAVKAGKVVQRQYLPNGKVNERILNEHGHTVSNAMYSDRSCSRREMYYTYEYTYKGDKPVHEKSFREVNGKMMLERESARKGDKITYIIYKDGKVDSRKTEEILEEVREEEKKGKDDENANALPPAPCLREKKESRDSNGNLVIARWEKCPGSEQRGSEEIITYDKNGLPLMAEYPGSNAKVIYTYTFRH